VERFDTSAEGAFFVMMNTAYLDRQEWHTTLQECYLLF
jgi:hypothetical protein